MSKKSSTPDMINLGPRQYIAVDSGLLSNFVPAVSKPPSFLRRVANKFFKLKPPKSAQVTTLTGSGIASPSIAWQLALQERYDKLGMVGDCNRLYREDPRVYKSINIYVEEATRAGVNIRIDSTGRLAERAKKIAKDIEVIANPTTLMSWGVSLLIEGNLFVQFGVDTETNRLVAMKRMPSVTIERMTDDADEFQNPDKAFVQLDVNTWSEVASWPLPLMSHVRWNHIDGDRYGTPEIVSVRRAFRKLDLTESAQTTRRLARATQRNIFNVGTPQNPGSPEEVENFANKYLLKEGTREPFDPMEPVRDYVGNGLVSGQTLQGDANIAEIDDVRYLQDVACAGLPTPKGLMGLDTESINRDVLEDQRSQWIKSTKKLTEALNQVINDAMNLMLLLHGIDPDLVDWTNIWAHSSVEREADRIDSIIALRESHLISRRTAMQNLAEYVGIQNIDTEEEAIKAEEEEFKKRQEESQGQMPEEEEEETKREKVYRPGKNRESNGDFTPLNPVNTPGSVKFERRSAAHKERRP